MLKLLKWDFLDIAKKYGKSFIGLLVLIFITMLIPKELINTGENFSIANIIAIVITMATAVITISMIFIGLILGFSRVFKCFKKDIKYLTMNIPIAPWKIVLEKLISFVIIFLSSFYFAKLFVALFLLIKGNDTNIRFEMGINIWQMLVSMLVMLSIILFAMFISKSFKFTRASAGFWSVIIFIIAMFLFSYFKNLLYILAGADYSFVKIGFMNGSIISKIFFTVNTNSISQTMNTIVYMGAHLIATLGLFFVNVKLLKDRVEI